MLISQTFLYLHENKRHFIKVFFTKVAKSHGNGFKNMDWTVLPCQMCSFTLTVQKFFIDHTNVQLIVQNFEKRC